MNDPQGSKWRKWDLHVHTPYSLSPSYGGNTEEHWERFFSDLESLPSEFKVLGINDYIFIEGYERVLKEKKAGRLANIDLILPVIEFRLDKFVGTSKDLRRINYHVIFSDSLLPDTIKSQFIAGLFADYQLSPQYEELNDTWAAIPNIQTLCELGKLIKKNVPDTRLNQYDSDLIEGFNNINFSLDVIKKVLDKPCFKGKHLVSLGKCEWDELAWTEQSIAEKKSIINGVHFLFLSSENPNNCLKAQNWLVENKLNHKLLDCSDAHSFSDSKNKDRIGKCFTWIKADTTFSGLQLALIEYDQRVFLGDTPPKIILVEANKSRFIQNLSINQVQSDKNFGWFQNININFNHDLVAIIGNKGMGKSALSDVLGLLGNSRNYLDFSFLNKNRFLSPPLRLGREFQATLTWSDNRSDDTQLDKEPKEDDPVTLRYIPQNLFDNLCNEIPGGAETNFDRELKDVVFSHVSDVERGGYSSLDSLLEYQVNEIRQTIIDLQQKLHLSNEFIQRAEISLKPEFKKNLENRLAVKTKELELLNNAIPIEVKNPQDGIYKTEDQNNIDQINIELTELTESITKLTTDLLSKRYNLITSSRLQQRIQNLQNTFHDFVTNSEAEFKQLGLSLETIITLTYNPQALLDEKNKLDQQIQILEQKLNASSSDSFTSRKQILENKIDEIKRKLNEPERRYRQYLIDHQTWENKKQEILGDESKSETISYYKNQLKRLETGPMQLQQAKNDRWELTQKIFKCLEQIQCASAKLYKPVQDFIDSQILTSKIFQLNFDVSIVNVDFKNKFFNFVTSNRPGDFFGVDTSNKFISNLVDEFDFNSFEEVKSFIEKVIAGLEKNAPPPIRGHQLQTFLRKDVLVSDLYDYLFSLNYLASRYVLKLGDKTLNTLSPGERGAVLLIFYLLIDQDTCPLIIDQPEENLDNQTIYELLVKTIIEAKKNRQILLVTHNPNLAIVCDAEQIIHCSIDKENSNLVKYTCGSIENPALRELALNILEGTKIAFDNRKLKYEINLEELLATDKH